jgi:hypothetical protein
MTWHVLPVNDIKVHDESTVCPCHPVVEITEEGNMIVIHSSFDGREYIERLIDKICKN